MKTTVSEKGQVTIPKTLRERLGIKAGQVLDVREDNGRLLVSKSETRDRVEESFGILDLGRSTDRVLALLRAEENRR